MEQVTENDYGSDSDKESNELPSEQEFSCEQLTQDREYIKGQLANLKKQQHQKGQAIEQLGIKL